MFNELPDTLALDDKRRVATWSATADHFRGAMLWLGFVITEALQEQQKRLAKTDDPIYAASVSVAAIRQHRAASLFVAIEDAWVKVGPYWKGREDATFGDVVKLYQAANEAERS
jgi:hypothetical protein